MAQLDKSQDRTDHIGKIVTFLISIGINKKHKMSFDCKLVPFTIFGTRF